MRLPRPARAALGLCALIQACNGSNGPADLPDPSLGTVTGYVATYDGLALEVYAAWIGWGIGPVPEPRLDAVRVRVANGADRPRAFDPRAVRIETVDGLQWPRIVAGTDPELRPVTLATFEDESGWIVFRIPAASRPVAVVWLAAPGLALRIPLPGPAKPT